MSLISLLSLLFLPVFSIVLGAGVGLLMSAALAAKQLELSVPSVLQLLWARLLETLPAESADAASPKPVQPPADSPFKALLTDADRWLIRWVQGRLLRRPVVLGSFPVTVMFQDLLHGMGLMWLAGLAYALARRLWLG